MTVITDNYDFYKKLQSLEGEDKRYVYTNKEYPNDFTMEDKRIVDGRYSPANNRLTRKHILLMICYCISIIQQRKCYYIWKIK